MERWGGESFETEQGLEERLVRAAYGERLRAAEDQPGGAGRYADVDEYDAVLRAHCRLA